MKSLSLTIIIFLLGCSNSLTSQPDTILIGYSPNDPGNAFITEMTLLSDGNIIFNHVTTEGIYSVYVVDSVGNVLYNRLLDEVEGYTIVSSNHILEDSGKYIFFGNATLGQKPYLISFSIDNTLSNISLIDTIALDDNTTAYFHTLKFNTDLNCWETIGVMRKTVEPKIFTSYFYVGIGSDYTFKRFHLFKTKYNPNYVLEFYWVRSLERYIFSCFNNSTIMVDANLNFVHEDAVKVTYMDSGIETTSLLELYNCVDDKNNLVFCYAKEFWDRAYNSAFVWLEIKDDTIVLNKAIPLASPPLGMQFESQMRKDSTGHYILSGTNGIPFLSGPSSTIKVARYSPDYNKVWEFSYQEPDKVFAILDMEIDRSNNIVLVGQVWNMFGDNKLRGFLMKIYANGTLSSYEEAPGPTGDKQLIRITPNPIVSSFCLRTEEPVRLLRFWDVGGRMVWEGLVDRLPYCGALPAGLPPGFYAAEVWFKDGRRAVEKVLVSGRE